MGAHFYRCSNAMTQHTRSQSRKVHSLACENSQALQCAGTSNHTRLDAKRTALHCTHSPHVILQRNRPAG